MSFYERVVFPWMNDRFVGPNRAVQQLREEVLAPARGDVVEVGFGTGLNLPHYPEGVTSITAVEPSEGMLARARERSASSNVRVDVVHHAGERLPLDDATFDTAVLVLTLCSVRDPDAVLSELHRVLKRDGLLLVLEHGLAPDSGVAKWQHRLNPLQNVIACGCNLDRDVQLLVERNGFRFESIRQFYMPRTPRPFAWLTLGTAARIG